MKGIVAEVNLYVKKTAIRIFNRVLVSEAYTTLSVPIFIDFLAPLTLELRQQIIQGMIIFKCCRAFHR